MKSCLIEIEVGQKVMEKESGRIGILKDIKLVPNGMKDTGLVVILYVYIEKKDVLVSSVSTNWAPVEEESYKEFYPSVHSNHLSDKILVLEKIKA